MLERQAELVSLGKDRRVLGGLEGWEWVERSREYTLRDSSNRYDSRQLFPMHTPSIPGFRPVPFTGVIFVMAEAAKHGYRPTYPTGATWARASRRRGRCPVRRPAGYAVAIDPADQDYAPVPGIPELRAAVAELVQSAVPRRA